MIRQKIILILSITVFAGCSGIPVSDVDFNPDYFNVGKPNFQTSQLTTVYKSSAFRPDVKVGEYLSAFSADIKTLYWMGNTEQHVRPYALQAVWYDPQGQVYFTERCVRKGAVLYMSSLKLKKKKDSAQIGQWRLEIRSQDNELLVQNRFYIGSAARPSDIVLTDVWTDPNYDISQASGIVLSRDVQITIDEQFRTSRRIYEKIKILNSDDKSLNIIYQPFVDWHETFFPGFAQTILPDGKIVPLIQMQLGTMRKGPPYYDPSRVIVLDFPAVEPGVVLEYEMSFLTISPLTRGMFYQAFPLTQALPVAVANYSVIVPAGVDLYSLGVRHPVQRVITEMPETGQRLYTWTVKNIPPLTVEKAMPPYREVGASLIVSTTEQWESVADWWREIAIMKYNQSDPIEKTIKAFKEGNPDLNTLIDRIYKFVKDEVRYEGLDFGRAVYEPATAAETLKNKSGDAKDLAILLKTLLDACGIDSSIGLVRTRSQGAVSSGISGAGEFNHVIIAAYGENGVPRYLDPTGSYLLKDVLPSEDYGADILIIKEEGIEQTRIPMDKMPKENGITIDVTAVMAEDFRVTGTLTIQFNGIFDGHFKSEFAQVQEGSVQNFIQKTLTQFYPGAKFGQCKISNQVENIKEATLQMSFKAADWLDRSDERYSLKLFGNGTIYPEYVYQKRVNPVVLDAAGFQKATVTLKLPDNLKTIELPKDQTFDNDLLQFHTQYRQEGDSIIRMENFIAEKKMIVTREEYPLFLKSYEDYAAALQPAVQLAPVQKTAVEMIEENKK
ncbi:MAG: DUF3857 domain-containing protein [Candidatus Omnitrophota bacterium]